MAMSEWDVDRPRRRNPRGLIVMALIEYERDEYGMVHIEVEASSAVEAARVWYMIYQETIGFDEDGKDAGGGD